MRCKLCDWSPDGPQSMYHQSLSVPWRNAHVDSETGEISCNCFNSAVDYQQDYYRIDAIEDIGAMEEGDLPDEG